MDIRKKWIDREKELLAIYERVAFAVRENYKIPIETAWNAAIPFSRPIGITGYLAGRGDTVLGVLPFYDFLYVPINFTIKNNNEFRQFYGIDTQYFCELIESHKIIPVFHAGSELYSDFIVKQIWSYLEVNNLQHLSCWQLNAIGVASQSISKIMLPWKDPSKDPWWTEMMIKASALKGRLIGPFPEDPTKFSSSLEEFNRLPIEIKSALSPLSTEKLDLISRMLSLSFSPSIPPSKYIEILDIKTTQALRRLFESAASLEGASSGEILELCKQYNNQIEEVTRSKGYKFAKVTSDLFTKHLLAVSFGIAGGIVGGPVPGLGGLIIGEVVQQVREFTEHKLGETIERGAKSHTAILSKLLGKDSELVHLCLVREAIQRVKSA